MQMEYTKRSWINGDDHPGTHYQFLLFFFLFFFFFFFLPLFLSTITSSRQKNREISLRPVNITCKVQNEATRKHFRKVTKMLFIDNNEDERVEASARTPLRMERGPSVSYLRESHAPCTCCVFGSGRAPHAAVVFRVRRRRRRAQCVVRGSLFAVSMTVSLFVRFAALFLIRSNSARVAGVLLRRNLST